MVGEGAGFHNTAVHEEDEGTESPAPHLIREVTRRNTKEERKEGSSISARWNGVSRSQPG